MYLRALSVGLERDDDVLPARKEATQPMRGLCLGAVVGLGDDEEDDGEEKDENDSERGGSAECICKRVQLATLGRLGYWHELIGEGQCHRVE